MDIWLIIFSVFIISAFFVLVIVSITKNVKKRIKPQTCCEVGPQIIYSPAAHRNQTRIPYPMTELPQSTNVMCHLSINPHNPQVSFNQPPHTSQVIFDNQPPPPYSQVINQSHSQVT